MKLKNLLFTTCASAAMIVFAVPSSAAAINRECVAGKPTAASYTWDFHSEANAIFANLQSEARQALDHADQLQSYADSQALGWETHANQLEPLRTEIDDMGAMLCRLETIRRVTTPWQQTTIDRIADTLQLMANNTQDAILFVNTHPNQLWLPRYEGCVDNLYNEAVSLTRNVGSAVQYARMSPEYRNLRHDLGVRTTS